MTKLTESAIEDFAITLFERLGYVYIHVPDGYNMQPALLSGKE